MALLLMLAHNGWTVKGDVLVPVNAREIESSAARNARIGEI